MLHNANFDKNQIKKVHSTKYLKYLSYDILRFQVNDVREARIDSVLEEISSTPLCFLPDDKPWTVEEFISKTQVGDLTILGIVLEDPTILFVTLTLALMLILTLIKMVGYSKHPCM